MFPIKRKFFYSSATSLLLQIITLLTGLVTSRLVLLSFGSETNGMLQSIAQFINYSTLLEAGAGGVINVAFYRAMAKNDTHEISGVMNASNLFFRQIALVTIVYTLALACVFPLITDSDYSYNQVFLFVIILGGQACIQCAVGRPNNLFLNVDYRSYILNLMQCIIILLHTCSTIYLVQTGKGIHMVKAASCFMFSLQPFMVYFYVKKHYPYLDPSIPPKMSALKERWNALGQHLAGFVNGSIDIFLLTIFTDFKTVSVYGVYTLVTRSLSGFLGSITGSFGPVLGRRLAEEDTDSTNRLLDKYECILYMVANIAFTTCAFLIVPFVDLYTKGISDMEYTNYVFGFALSFLGFLNAVKTLYYSTVFSAGHYKQTGRSSYEEMFINLGFSLLLVQWNGLLGVVFATIISTFYKTGHCIWYLRQHILMRKRMAFAKIWAVNLLALSINVGIFLSFSSCFIVHDLESWVVLGFVTFGVSGIVVLLLHILFYGGLMKEILLMVYKGVFKK